jgi:hypothetical protein
MTFALFAFAFALTRAVAMAPHTMRRVGNPPAGMAGLDCIGLMLMTAETGVLAGIAAAVAGFAGRLVRAGQRKQPCVIE